MKTIGPVSLEEALAELDPEVRALAEKEFTFTLTGIESAELFSAAMNWAKYLNNENGPRLRGIAEKLGKQYAAELAKVKS